MVEAKKKISERGNSEEEEGAQPAEEEAEDEESVWGKKNGEKSFLPSASCAQRVPRRVTLGNGLNAQADRGRRIG